MSGQLLIDYVRGIGIPCRGIIGGLHCGWTTDEARARLAKQHGATVTAKGAQDPAFSGWEVSFLQGSEVTEGVPS